MKEMEPIKQTVISAVAADSKITRPAETTSTESASAESPRKRIRRSAPPSGIVPVLMTRNDVAAYLNLGLTTVGKLARESTGGEGEFPLPVRLNARCTRWRRADIENWAALVAGVPFGSKPSSRRPKEVA